MRAKHDDGVLTVRWPWCDAYLDPLIVLSVTWNGIMIACIARALVDQKQPPLALWAFAAIGPLLGYCVAASYFNFSCVHATANYLEVKHGPFPWPNCEILRDKIACLTCDSSSFSIYPRWSLYALLINGRKIKLAGGLDVHELHFLQRKLADRLNLPPEF
jgi:hypothetical protein